MWAWYFLQVLVAVIPGEPLEISGGYAFGAVQGTVLCMLGAFLGGVVVFAFVRRFGRELVEVFFPKEKIESLRFLQSSPSGICCSGSYSLCRERPRIFCATLQG